MIKKSIFIVEDSKDIGFILTYLLNDEGFDVTIFETVADFQKAFRCRIPDLYLLDIMLPDGDGISLCYEIKHDKRSCKTPVLLMSAHESADKIIRETDADGFISKPFDINCMVGKIRRYIC